MGWDYDDGDDDDVIFVVILGKGVVRERKSSVLLGMRNFICL